MKLFISACLSSLLFFSCTNSKPPNIIWLVAEDQSPNFLPMYGDKTMKLPNLEALASDGITFTNAYSPAPVCAPARSALITGMYPTSLGTHNMRTFNTYNTENEPSIGIPSYSPILPEGVKMFPEYMRAKGYYTSNNAKEDYNFKKTAGAWDESSTKANWKNRKDGQPFFAVFNFGITHESQIWIQGKNTLLVDPEKVKIPPVFPDTPEVRKDLAVNYSNLVRLDQQIGVIIQELKEEGLYENSIIFFYGDHGGPFPRYKRALYETGLKVPLFIKFPGNKDAGTKNDAFISFIDYAPSILSLAGIYPPKIMQGKALFGTYKTEQDSKFVFAASDRFDEKVDRLRALRYSNFKYIKNFNSEISNAMPLIYREQMPMMQNLNALKNQGLLEENVAKWFQTPKPREELYDIDVDPYELNNLAEVTSLRDTLIYLRGVMDKWIIETGDLGAISEKQLIKKWFPENKAPELKSPKFNRIDNTLEIKHAKTGVTIVWKTVQDSIWNIYTKPLKDSKKIIAKAVRIGYVDSPKTISN